MDGEMCILVVVLTNRAWIAHGRRHDQVHAVHFHIVTKPNHVVYKYPTLEFEGVKPRETKLQASN